MKDTIQARKFQKWLEENKDVMLVLGKKLRQADTCKKGIYSEYPEESRRLAIEIIEGWMSEVYSIAWESEFVYPEDEDEFVEYLDRPTE